MFSIVLHFFLLRTTILSKFGFLDKGMPNGWGQYAKTVTVPPNKNEHRPHFWSKNRKNLAYSNAHLHFDIGHSHSIFDILFPLFPFAFPFLCVILSLE
jgi:hypothetical protein